MKDTKVGNRPAALSLSGELLIFSGLVLTD
jgi:hypothetical protein